MSAIAYFITIHSYGTRNRGDSRGWIDCDHNQYGTPFAKPDGALAATHAARMKFEPVIFARDAREIIRRAIVDVSEHLNLRLHRENVRTEHAHIVVSSRSDTSRTQASIDPAILRGKFKSRSTRLLVEGGLYKQGARLEFRLSEQKLSRRNSKIPAANLTVGAPAR